MRLRIIQNSKFQMSHMPFVASPAPIHRHSLGFEFRVLIEIFPRIILGLVSHLSLPRMLLSSIMFRVRLERRNLVEVFVSVIAHVSFCVVLCIPLSVKPFHSRLALIPFLPHKPGVSGCAANNRIEISVGSAFQP